MFGGIPAVVIGSVLLVLAIGAILVAVARRPDRLTLLVGLSVLALAFFVVPTRVHERYGFPFFALGVILAAISWRWRIAYLVLTVATFANMYVVLTTLYPDNPSVEDWLGIGPTIRSPAGVVIFSLMHAAAFAWAFVQLRSSAHETLEDELAFASGEEDDWLDDEEAGVGRGARAGAGGRGARRRRGAAEPPRPVLPAAVAPGARPVAGRPAVAVPARMPAWTPRAGFDDLGVVGWFRARLSDIPIRPDRSALLRFEGGGRLDRLDLWFVLVILVGSMLLRTYRLEEPYKMHFDEVYHARTAAEFLQDWRYDIPHDIYEWTHPHLAKYAMALGMVVWGQDGVAASSDLEVPVVAAAVEPRRIDEAASNARAGERMHLATGTEIRTYDLQSRALISTIAAPGVSALAVDEDGGRLIVGYDDGRLATIELGVISDGDGGSGIQPVEVATVDHPIEHLLVTENGADVVAASSERLTTVGLDSGEAVGSLDLPGIADLSLGGSGSAIVATVDDIADHAAFATSLADILKNDKAADYQARLDAASPGTTVVLGNPPGIGEPRKALDAAIADDTLAGVQIETIERFAVATDAGVAFVDRERTSVITTIELEGGAHGLAMVTGLDDPRVYATTGTADDPHYDVIAVGGDKAKDGPTDKAPDMGLKPLPGLGSLVAYDEASQMVHILGLAPDATPPAARGRSTSSSRTATRSSPTLACPTASSRRPGARTSTPTTPPRTASSSSSTRATAPRPRSTPARTPSPGDSRASSRAP